MKPPQWLGYGPAIAVTQLVEMQKRIGLVGQKFWRDGPRAHFLRFKFLLEARGAVQRFSQLNGALEPYNPAIRGQEYQEVQIATQLLALMMSYGGVQGQALCPATPGRCRDDALDYLRRIDRAAVLSGI